ncbi:hypothetical protein V8C86DRAFT_3117700 [Haematococcus lacustris]
MQPRLPEVVANSPNTAHFILGVDWMTMGKNGTWSVGVIMVKLLDVPPEVCGKRVNSSVLAVIDGGQHQSHLTGYLDLICRDIRKHVLGPGDLGVLVEPHPGPGVDGVAPARVEPVRIHGVPVMSIADTLAALKVQEENVGRTCLFGELWIERVLHDLKSITTSGIPGPQLDAHIAKRAAMQNASSKLHDRTDPDGQQDYNARLRDEVFGDGQQALLLGAGSTVCPLPNSPGAMVQGCIKAVEDVRASDDNTPWRTHHVKRLFAEPLTPEEAEEEAREAPRVAGPAAVDPVRYYQRAECNGTTVLSRVYKRPFKRNSTWASMPFRTSSDTIVIWAGHVQFWARLYPDHSRRLQQEQ